MPPKEHIMEKCITFACLLRICLLTASVSQQEPVADHISFRDGNGGEEQMLSGIFASGSFVY